MCETRTLKQKGLPPQTTSTRKSQNLVPSDHDVVGSSSLTVLHWESTQCYTGRAHELDVGTIAMQR
eukprot:465219-Rhodomonas_salina.1